MDCEYPGAELAPTTVIFAPRGLGDDAAVDLAFRTLLRRMDYFEVSAAGEPDPLPFSSETVRRVVVWSEEVMS